MADRKPQIAIAPASQLGAPKRTSSRLLGIWNRA